MGIKDDLTAWKALLLTARTGKVTQTGIMMDMTSSKVSRLLTGLEEELGYPLFDRTRRPMQATDRCRQLIAVLEPVLRDFQELQTPTFGLNKKTLIRVAAPIEAALDFYCLDFMHYAQEHENIEFEIMPEVTEQAVRERRVDVAMLNHNPDDKSEFTVRSVSTTTTFPLATPEYLRRYGVPQKLDDLREHRGILLKTQTFPVTRFLHKGNLTSAALQWKSCFYTHDQFMIKKLVMNHWGIAVDLYGGHVLKELESGELVPVLPGWSRPNWNMCIVTRQDVDMTSKEIRSFADWWASRQSSCDQQRMVASHALTQSAHEKSQRQATKGTPSVPA